MAFYPFTILTSLPVTEVGPSGDTTGITDAANLTAAAATVPAKGGIVQMAATGPWYLKGGNLIIARSGLYLNAPGCYINAVGSGDIIRMYNQTLFTGGNLNYPPVPGGGIIGGPVIDGTNHTGTATGLHLGDINQCFVDVKVQNFTAAGDIGAHFDNQWFWTEQGRIYVASYACASAVTFDQNPAGGSTDCTGSFDGCEADLYVIQGSGNAGFNGVSFLNGTYFKTGSLSIRGGFTSSSASIGNTAVLALIGQSPVGSLDSGVFSNLDQIQLNIGVECTTGSGSNAPYTIYMGTPSSGNFISDCYGVLAFNGVGTAFRTTNGSSVTTIWAPIDGDVTNPSISKFVSFNNGMFAASPFSASSLELFGNLDINSAGFGLQVAEGSNCKQGTLTLNGTTAVVVSNTSVTANSRIFLTIQLGSGTVGSPYVSARTAGTSFSVKSTTAGDVSTCAYEIFEPG